MNFVYPPCYPVCSCEPFVKGLILQPWAFWTSLLYLPAIYFVAKKNGNVTHSWMTAIILVTFASLVAHANFDTLSLAVDESAVVLVLFSYHLKEKSWSRAFGQNLFLITICTMIFYFLPLASWVPLVFGAFLFSAYLAWKKVGAEAFKEKEFLLSMAIYGVSFLLFQFDKNPLLCETKFLPYGHPTWHAGAALTTYMFGDWWFRKLRAGK